MKKIVVFVVLTLGFMGTNLFAEELSNKASANNSIKMETKEEVKADSKTTTSGKLSQKEREDIERQIREYEEELVKMDATVKRLKAEINANINVDGNEISLQMHDEIRKVIVEEIKALKAQLGK